MNSDTLSNHGPFGLMGFGMMGFGMTTVLLIFTKHFFSNQRNDSCNGLFLWGMAQIIAGVLEFKKGNTFGVTAFIS